MNRLQFTGPYRHQNWSLPDSIIYYMAKHPSNSKVYQKLIQSCKYFFIKNSIIVLYCLHFSKNGWKTCTKECEFKDNDMRKIELENISSKLWILDTFGLCYDKTLTPPSIISKIYKCQVKVCRLLNQSIILNELLFLASSAECCRLIKSTVRDNNDGSPLQLEIIVSHLKKLQKLCVEFSSNAPNISSKTAKRLLELPHFPNINQLALFNLPESFDFDTLFEYYKGTKNMLLNIKFCNSISDAFKNRLDVLVDEILKTSSRTTYRTPHLVYPGQNEDKKKTLYQRFLKDNF